MKKCKKISVAKNVKLNTRSLTQASLISQGKHINALNKLISNSEINFD